MNKKIIISQATTDNKERMRSNKEVVVKNLVLQGFSIIPFEDKKSYGINKLDRLGNFIKLMSNCSAILFMKGWGDSKLCKLHHTIATEYGLDIYYEGHVFMSYKPGDLVIYTKGDVMELGVVKRNLGVNKFAVCYHTGDTAACTNGADLKRYHPKYFMQISNGYAYDVIMEKSTQWSGKYK